MRAALASALASISLLTPACAGEVPVELSPPIREYLLQEQREIEFLKHRIDQLELELWRSRVELSRRTLHVPPRRAQETPAERALRQLDEGESQKIEKASRCVEDYGLPPDRCPLFQRP